MSRRPGPDFTYSNGHARSALLSDPRPLSSNLFFQSTDALKPADLRKKFLDACRDDGHDWCLEVKRMDNPALSSVRQEDFSEFVGEVGRRNRQRRTRAAAGLSRVRGRWPRRNGARRTSSKDSRCARCATFSRSATTPPSYTYMQNPAGRLRRNGARRLRLGAGRHPQHGRRSFAPARRRRNPRLPRRAPPPAARPRPATEVTIRPGSSSRGVRRGGRRGISPFL